MYIELKCRSCGKNFRVDFTSNEYDINNKDFVYDDLLPRHRSGGRTAPEHGRNCGRRYSG